MSSDTNEEWGRESLKRPRVRRLEVDHGSEQSTSCLLFRLPREVRDIIYNHLIPNNDSQSGDVDCDDALNMDRSMRVLRAVDQDRHAHREALEIYFRTKTFVFDSVDSIERFRRVVTRMKSRSVDVYSELRRVEIVGWEWMNDNIMKDHPFHWHQTFSFVLSCTELLAQCKNLSSVKICLDEKYFHVYKVLPLFGRVQGRIQFETKLWESVETKCIPGSREYLQRFLEAEKALASSNTSQDWAHFCAILDAVEL